MNTLRIYDENQLNAKLRIRRLYATALFAGGSVCGFWYAQSGNGSAVAQSLEQPTSGSQSKTASSESWCVPETWGKEHLQLDCKLSQARKVAS